MILSLCLFSLGVACYAIKELQSHGKLKWMKSGTGFWDERSWLRKWADTFGNKEAFPLSSTALVWLTDGYHLMQFFYIKLFIASIILYVPVFGWWRDGLIYLGCWYVVFNVIYKAFGK